MQRVHKEAETASTAPALSLSGVAVARSARCPAQDGEKGDADAQQARVYAAAAAASISSAP